MPRRPNIVCHSWDEESVLLDVNGKQEWFRILHAALGPYVIIHGRPWRVGTCDCWPIGDLTPGAR